MQARAYRSIEPFDAAIASLKDYVNHLLKNNARPVQQSSARD